LVDRHANLKCTGPLPETSTTTYVRNKFSTIEYADAQYVIFPLLKVFIEKIKNMIFVLMSSHKTKPYNLRTYEGCANQTCNQNRVHNSAKCKLGSPYTVCNGKVQREKLLILNMDLSTDMVRNMDIILRCDTTSETVGSNYHTCSVFMIIFI